MAKPNKLEVKFSKPPVRFSESGAPYIEVQDIFHSAEGQRVISRMAELRAKAEKSEHPERLTDIE